MNEYEWNPEETSCPPNQPDGEDSQTINEEDACSVNEEDICPETDGESEHTETENFFFADTEEACTASEENTGAEDKENFVSMDGEKATEPIPPAKKQHSWLRPFLISLGTSVACLVIFSVLILPHLRPSTVISYAPPVGSAGEGTAVAPSQPADTDMFQTVGNRALGSVVQITNQGSLGGFFSQVISFGEGVGAIVSEDGYILTSSYIVESKGKITVTMADGAEYAANVVGTDSTSGAAVLKIEANGLMPVTIGDSDAVVLGDSVIAIGSSISKKMTSPVTTGVICGINKNVSLQDGTTVNLFQTDAAMIGESIGGALFNTAGQMIGMATAVADDTDEISLITPINDIKPVLESMINSQNGPKVPELGISGTDAEYGVGVTAVAEDSPAARAGMRVGDLIVKADGEPVTSVAKINQLRVRHKAGDKMVLTVYREGELLELTAELS